MLTTTAPDGRQLAWDEYGDPLGAPVVVLHGTPGGRLGMAPLPSCELLSWQGLGHAPGPAELTELFTTLVTR